MRTIKCRGFNKNENKWVYGHLAYSEQGRPFIVGAIVESNEEYVSFSFWCPVVPESVGEFTGLTDKNGKEIWEGDILGHVDGDKYEVYWEETAGCFLAKPNISYKQRVSGYTFTGTSYEVLGNIYSNPELLSPRQSSLKEDK